MRISKWEKALITWIENHILLLLFCAVTLLGFVIRISLWEFMTDDAYYFLLPWFDIIKANGGIRGLATQVGDYNLLYQFLISIMTYIPIPALYAYKILSCAFDYALAIAAAFVTRHLLPQGSNKIPAFAAYTLVLLSPLVFLNSSAWAQCDSIYTFFAICSFYFLCKERYYLSFLCLGMAFAFKLQAIFLLPFFLLVWFMKREFSIATFLWIPVVMIVTALPAIFAGRNPLDIILIYANQTDTWRALYMNYPGFLALFTPHNLFNYTAFRNMSIAFTMAVLLVWATVVIHNKVPATSRNLLYLFFILCYTCVFFLPSMHDRYGYVYEITAIILAIVDKRTRPLAIGLLFTTLMSYAIYLFDYSFIPYGVIAAINLCVYLLYSRHILQQFLEPAKA